MTHKKWPRVENSYRQEFIDRFLREFPELEEETYVITEKLHGRNLSVFFQPNQPWQIGKRTAFLAEGEKFAGIQDVLPKYTSSLEYIQEHVDLGTYTIRLFGEFCGPGIQKGVSYGPKKRIFFFGIMIDDILIPFDEFQNYASFFDFKEHLVPVVATVSGLEKALAFDAEFASLLNPVEENICEGVVIQPYRKVYATAQGKRFLLKKKNEKFLEKSKEKRPPSPGDPEIERLNAEFKLCLTDNRLQGIFSKHGEIQEKAQLGEYIVLILEDAKEDFLADHGDALAKLEKGEQRKVFNVGGMIAHMLKEYL